MWEVESRPETRAESAPETKEQKEELPEEIQEVIDDMQEVIESEKVTFKRADGLARDLEARINEHEDQGSLYFKTLAKLRKLKEENRKYRRGYQRLIRRIRKSTRKLERPERIETRKKLRALKYGRKQVTKEEGKNMQSETRGEKRVGKTKTRMARLRERQERRKKRVSHLSRRRRAKILTDDQIASIRATGRYGNGKRKGIRERLATARSARKERREERKTRVALNRRQKKVVNEKGKWKYRHKNLDGRTAFKIKQEDQRELNKIARTNKRYQRKEEKRITRSARKERRYARRLGEEPKVKDFGPEIAALKRKLKESERNPNPPPDAPFIAARRLPEWPD